MKKYNQATCENYFEKFSLWVEKKIGLLLANDDWESVSKKIQPLNDCFGFRNIEDCLKWIINSNLTKEQIATVAKYLTIGETYFFRDKHLFDTLENNIFPEMIQKKRGCNQHIKIWSAACCTGEEPYSIAILLHKLLPDKSQWNISILGTDINIDYLSKAEKGIYKNWSFRQTPKAIKDIYFVNDRDDRYVLIPEIRRMVKFNYLNLVEDMYPAILNGTIAVDLILCNNVLIYFSPEKIQRVIHQLAYALVDAGWLVMSSIEVPYVKEKSLLPCRLNETMVFRKLSESEAQSAENKPNAYSENFIETSIKELPPSVTNESSNFIPQKQSPYVSQVKSTHAIDIKHYENLYEKGLYTELIDSLQKALLSIKNLDKQAGLYSKGILLLARSLANIGKRQQAKEWMQKSLKFEKLDTTSYFLYATLLQDLGHMDEAIQYLKKALYLNPEFTIAYYVLGNLWLQMGNREEAERNFRNALQLLQKSDENALLEDAEGMTAGRLAEIIQFIQRHQN